MWEVLRYLIGIGLCGMFWVYWKVIDLGFVECGRIYWYEVYWKLCNVVWCVSVGLVFCVFGSLLFCGSENLIGLGWRLCYV